MLADTFNLNVRDVDYDFTRVVPQGANSGEFVRVGSTRAEPLSLSIIQSRQGNAGNPVLRQVRTWKQTKIDTESSKPYTITSVHTLYLPLLSSILTAEAGGFVTFPTLLVELDTAFCFGPSWSQTTGPGDAARFTDWVRGGA